MWAVDKDGSGPESSDCEVTSDSGSDAESAAEYSDSDDEWEEIVSEDEYFEDSSSDNGKEVGGLRLEEDSRWEGEGEEQPCLEGLGEYELTEKGKKGKKKGGKKKGGKKKGGKKKGGKKKK
jgi:hypothetical protein